MTEHYMRGTTECIAYCKVCKRDTRHRVDDVRRGPCLEHHAPEFSKKQLAARKKREQDKENPKLLE